MKLETFAGLDQEDQLDYLIHKGVCISDRETKTTIVLLYQIHGFYVELYHNIDSHEIERLRVFSSLFSLDPYLEQINISSLLKKVLFVPFFDLIELVTL